MLPIEVESDKLLPLKLQKPFLAHRLERHYHFAMLVNITVQAFVVGDIIKRMVRRFIYEVRPSEASRAVVVVIKEYAASTIKSIDVNSKEQVLYGMYVDVFHREARQVAVLVHQFEALLRFCIHEVAEADTIFGMSEEHHPFSEFIAVKLWRCVIAVVHEFYVSI